MADSIRGLHEKSMDIIRRHRLDKPINGRRVNHTGAGFIASAPTGVPFKKRPKTEKGSLSGGVHEAIEELVKAIEETGRLLS
jgi:hypothetical protein